MFMRIVNYLRNLRDGQRISIALSKGSAMLKSREVDLKYPASWEFSGFSQNGEDGILEVLRHQLTTSNRYFIEIGSADGIENNSAWLAVAEKYNGLMIEGNRKSVEQAKVGILSYSLGVECHNMFVTVDSVEELRSMILYIDPDVFSLDIDGNDYHVARAIIETGIRPKICVVEYNSAFGPDRAVTIEYNERFSFKDAHPTHLYYGVSLAGWRKYFESIGYRFITVDRNGVNVFFVAPEYFKPEFLDGIEGNLFAENFYQLMKFKVTHEKQFQLISDQKFMSI